MAEVVFVGTGDAFGSGGRRNSAILCRHRGRTLLLDCGPTTLNGLKSLGVDPGEIDAVAISHYHGDHFAGLPFLLLEYLYESPREHPLHLLGPPEIRRRTERLTEQFCYSSDFLPRYATEYGEFKSGVSHEVAGFGITPVPAYHHPTTLPFMLRVTFGDRALFFSGDTGWHEEFPEKVGDVSLLISECCLMDEGFEFHLSHERLQKERERFAAERIVLTHLGADVIRDRDRVSFETADDGLRVSL